MSARALYLYYRVSLRSDEVVAPYKVHFFSSFILVSLAGRAYYGLKSLNDSNFFLHGNK